MSEFANIPVGRQAQDMDISPVFRPYSGVEIIVSEDSMIPWPKDDAERNSGRVLRIENPWGTIEQAKNIYASLVKSGFQYQPYVANNALVNPAAELGDAVAVNGTYSGIYKMSRNYSSLMAADIEAPQDEAIDHEFPYEPKQDRIYKREIADAQAQIKFNYDSIESEVTRAKNSENELRSSITQTANDINAEVSKKVTADTGETSRKTFGWTLTSNSWRLYSDDKTVFKATKDGVEVTGKITASSGEIGGFTIGTNSITTNGQTWNGHKQGIYIGNNGIQLGSLDGSYFWASQSGNVVARNMTLTGTLKIAGTEIDASKLRIGAQSSYDNRSTWSTGAGYGYNYNAATDQNSSSYPSYFKAGTLICDRIRIGGHVCGFITVTIDGQQRSVLMSLT